ncbi:peptidylprolyl isomerase [Synechococcus sp. AH-551-E02]|nr:peptidylprolyl isomerase [Synechococcus sp. AH-551-E02]
MDTSQVLDELKTVIGDDGRSLLQRYGLLQPLVTKMMTSQAIAAVEVSDQDLNQARLDLLEEKGYDGIEQWPQLIAGLAGTEPEVMTALTNKVRQQTFLREQFLPKAEARFLDRKNELDQVVYSLLRLKNRFLAQELYLQIESGESNFADLAKRYAEGLEQNTNGIMGPVPLTKAHPVLAEKLRVTRPGVLLEPFRISEWWLVVRLERYSPATFSDEISDRMCQELLAEWQKEQTLACLKQLT